MGKLLEAIHTVGLGGYLVLVVILVLVLHIFLEIKRRRSHLPNCGEMARELILENIEEGLLVIDRNGEILFCNKVVCMLMQKNLLVMSDIVENKVTQIENEGCIYEVRRSVLPKESRVKGFIVRFVDITQLVRQRDELLRMKEEADEANRFKSAFLANMSHEIRTPIHAIIGFSELMMQEENSDASREKLDMIKSSSYNLLAIINDVLDISKIESGKMELVMTNYYISYIIRDIEATFSLMAMQKGLEFRMDIDETIPCRLYGDKIRIRGVLVNILNNAVKYTRKGSVTFAVRNLGQKEDRIKLAFVVKDTGIGIRKEEQGHLFESFRRLDKQKNDSIEGTGLGLSIAYAYVQMMDGDIQVKSEYGVGSEFTVILEQQVMDANPIDMKYVHVKKRKRIEKFHVCDYEVLVVDDNQVNLMVAEGLLKTYGVKVDRASSGLEAVEMCRNKKYPLIFMDQMMPEVDGKMAMDAIRDLSDYYQQEAYIVVLTADAMSGARKRLMQQGFDEYLCKPLEVARLEDLLLQIVPEDKVQKGALVEENRKDGDIGERRAQIKELATGLEMDETLIEQKIENCGGQLEDYLNICRIAYHHGFDKIRKLRESWKAKDYDRYILEVHSLKSTAASIGAMEISEQAKEQEYAGKEGDYALIDEKMEQLLQNYEEFLQKLERTVFGTDAMTDMQGEEWEQEEIQRICTKILELVNAFRFGEVFDILEQVRQVPQGEKTRALFQKIEDAMNDMDIDKVKRLIEEVV